MDEELRGNLARYSGQQVRASDDLSSEMTIAQRLQLRPHQVSSLYFSSAYATYLNPVLNVRIVDLEPTEDGQLRLHDTSLAGKPQPFLEHHNAASQGPWCEQVGRHLYEFALSLQLLSYQEHLVVKGFAESVIALHRFPMERWPFHSMLRPMPIRDGKGHWQPWVGLACQEELLDAPRLSLDDFEFPLDSEAQKMGHRHPLNLARRLSDYLHGPQELGEMTKRLQDLVRLLLY